MGRLCERPGCSESAAVVYGMRPEDLVFWLDAMRDDSAETGVLCQRHGDSMVVPRGWTLDDLRDPDLHLFRPPRSATVAARSRTRRRRPTDDTEQLRLGVADPTDAVRPTVTETVDPSSTDADDDVAGTHERHDPADPDDPDDSDDPEAVSSAPPAPAWTPHFDAGDDHFDGGRQQRSVPARWARHRRRLSAGS